MRAGTITSPASPRPAARWASPGSTCRPARFRSAPTSEASLARRSRPDRCRARSWCPSGCWRGRPCSSCSADWKAALTPLANPRFDSETARRRLESFYGVKALDGFGRFGRAEIAAAGALVDYVALTQQGPSVAAARRIWRRRSGSRPARSCRSTPRHGAISNWRRRCRASAAAACSRPSTAPLTGAGARLLAEHLAAPLTDPGGDRGAARRGAASFVDRPDTRGAAARAAAPASPDIERALTPPQPRPRRPARPRRAARRARRDRGRSARSSRTGPRAAAGDAGAGREPGLASTAPLVERARRGRWPPNCRCWPATAASSPPATRPSSTSCASCATTAGRRSPRCRRAMPRATGVAALKIRHNNVIGYYIEVSAANAGKLGGAGRFHPPPDDGRRGALHHRRARRARPQDRQRRRPALALELRALRRPGRRGDWRAGAAIAAAARGAGRARPRRRAAPRRRRAAAGAARDRPRHRLSTSSAAAIRWSRRRSAGRGRLRRQ